MRRCRCPLDRRALLTTAILVTLATIGGCADDDRADAGNDPTPTSAADPRSDGPATTTTTTTTPPSCDPPVGVPLAAGPATLASGGVDREHLVALPPSFEPTSPTPVLVNLHGSGSSMEEQAVYSKFPDEAGARGYVTVTPNGQGDPRGWELGGGDDDYVVALLDDLAERMCVDPARVFVAGMSNGSALSGFLVCRHPDRFAAAAMVAASVPSLCAEGEARPVIAFHGTADGIVPYDGGKVRSEGAAGLAAPGVEDTLAGWAEHAGCEADAEVERIGDDVLRHRWPGCRDDADVELYVVEEGGHTWPGSIDLAALGITHLGATTPTIDATQLILDFFDDHPRR